MKINDNLKDYVPYEQMSDYEKRQVDMLVEQYKNGSLNSDYTGITHNDVDRFINTRLDLEHLAKINDKIIEPPFPGCPLNECNAIPVVRGPLEKGFLW